MSPTDPDAALVERVADTLRPLLLDVRYAEVAARAIIADVRAAIAAMREGEAIAKSTAPAGALARCPKCASRHWGVRDYTDEDKATPYEGHCYDCEQTGPRQSSYGAAEDSFLQGDTAAPTPASVSADAVEVVRAFKLGDRVCKTKGSSWQGIVVGTYSTSLTPEGYAVESEREPGSVQIYPAAALRAIGRGPKSS